MKIAEKKIFKPSKFNFTIQDSDRKVFLFNGLHSSLIQLPEALYPVAQDIFSRTKIFASVLPIELTPFFEILKEGGFLVEDTFDELATIKERFHRDREGGPMHLIITPTLDCNLACIYCYQARTSETMTFDICDRIIEFVYKNLEKSRSIIPKIQVDWYGGEPLLGQHIISYVSGRLMHIANEFNCEYEASIATNGTLLDDNAVNMLISNKVNACQITIDGPKEIHDQRRGYRRAKESSFERILKNIKRVIGKIELSVRINVDATNIKYVNTLLDIFKDEGFFQEKAFGFFPYLSMTGPINPCMPFNCVPVDAHDFYKKNLEFQERVFEYSGKNCLKPIFDFPFPVSVTCGALRSNSYAFDPKGRYFKCGLEIGEAEKVCGNVYGEINVPQYQKWENYDPLIDIECLDCRYLPFCMGGCPKVKFDKNNFYGKEGCMYWKGNLEDIVKLYAGKIVELRKCQMQARPFRRRL